MKKLLMILSTLSIFFILVACNSKDSSEQESDKKSDSKEEKSHHLKVSMVIPGNIKDKGLMESGYNGLMKIKDDLGAEVSYKDEIKPEMNPRVNASKALATAQPDRMITQGGQGTA